MEIDDARALLDIHPTVCLVLFPVTTMEVVPTLVFEYAISAIYRPLSL